MSHLAAITEIVLTIAGGLLLLAIIFIGFWIALWWIAYNIWGEK